MTIVDRMRAQVDREARKIHEQTVPYDQGVMARSAADHVGPERGSPFIRSRPSDEVFERGGIIPSSSMVAAAERLRQIASCGLYAHQMACSTQHTNTVPVWTTGLDEDLVAWLCTDCDYQLPAGWKRPDAGHDHREVVEAATYMPEGITRIKFRKEAP